MPSITPRLKPPLRDAQQDAPACYCKRCGGEIYSGETLYTWESQGICTDCLKAVVTAWLAEAPKEVAATLGVEMEEVNDV